MDRELFIFIGALTLVAIVVTLLRIKAAKNKYK